MNKWISGLLLLLVASCAGKPLPDFMAADFEADVMDNIAVLSVVDHRIDTEKEVKLDKWTKPFVKKRMKKAGYDYAFEPAPEYVASVSVDGLEDEDPDMITALGPDNSRWVLLLVLHDASSKMTFGSSGAAEMTGYLFDKQEQKVVWRNKEFAEMSQGGLMGMALKGSMQRSAIEMATHQILAALPDKEDD